MNIGIYHGYELIGSGSNEYTRYLARELAKFGHTLHVLCREERPEDISFISKAYQWDINGNQKLLFERETGIECIVHQIPHASIRPVYVTDKKRAGNVKSFKNLNDEELAEYHQVNHDTVLRILQKYTLDVLHCNHLVYQPVAAMDACIQTKTPFVIFLHGSAIEYTVRGDVRYEKLALEAIQKCDGIISGNNEVCQRLPNLYPELKDMILAKSRIVGIGVDTTLFTSIKKTERNKSLAHLKKYDGPLGKSKKLTEALKKEIDKGDIYATGKFWNDYNDYAPDQELVEKVNSIPWETGNVLLFVGALTSGKGLQSVIPALPEIIHSNPDTHMVIIGGGAYREVLEALVYSISSGNKKVFLELCDKGIDLDRNDYSGGWNDVKAFISQGDNLEKLFKYGKGLDKHVHFLGRLNHDYLQYIFPCADIALFPSIGSEAYGLVLMEALSNGVFPMVSYFSGFVDGIDDLEKYLDKKTVNLMKISIEDDKRIQSVIDNVNKVVKVLNNKPLANKLRPIAVQNYDWKIRAEQMIQTYSSLKS